MNYPKIIPKSLILSLKYDQENGLIYRIYPHGKTKILKTKDKLGYLIFYFLKKRFFVHRVIYFIETNEQPMVIDHVDGNVTNNKISNLRSSTTRKNAQNQKRHRSGKLVGSTFNKQSGKWKSQIQIKNKKIFLGYFKTEIEAHERYIQELKTRGLL